MKPLKIIGAILFILSIIVYFTSDFLLEKKLRIELSKLINKDSLSLYTYDFTGFNLNLIEGSIKLEGIKLMPTKAAREGIKSSHNNIRVLIEASCDKLKMEGFDVNHFLKTGQIQIERFVVRKPKVTYLFNNSKKGSKNTITLDNIFTDAFTNATLRHFIIDNANIDVHSIKDDKDILVFKDVDFHLTNAYMDSTTIKRFSPFDYQNIEFTVNKLALDLDEDFTISSGILDFNAENNTISIDGVKISPKYSQENFSKKYPYQKAWFALTLDKIELTNIDFERLIENGDFQIGKLDLEKANLYLYKDKTLPEQPVKKKLLPASALKNLPFTVSISETSISNSFIKIDEKSSLSNKVSELTFNNVNATIKDITNDAKIIPNNRFMNVEAHASLLNNVPVTLQAKFDLASSNDTHYIHANIAASDATIYNKVLDPMLLVQIKSGNILHLDFSYEGNNTSCEGSMNFEYENFKIDIYNVEEHDKKQGLLSLAANTVIKSTNTKDMGSSYTKGVIRANRIQSKDIFPYIWHAAQSGIVYTMAPLLSDVKKNEKIARKEARKN